MNRPRSRSDTEDLVASALDRLREELAVVRHVLDDIRCELQWTNRNCADGDSPATSFRRITSMPLDPTSPDWAKRLNRFTATNLPPEAQHCEAADQSRLF